LKLLKLGRSFEERKTSTKLSLQKKKLSNSIQNSQAGRRRFDPGRPLQFTVRLIIPALFVLLLLLLLFKQLMKFLVIDGGENQFRRQPNRLRKKRGAVFGAPFSHRSARLS
jgi:hypothetical protein